MIRLSIALHLVSPNQDDPAPEIKEVQRMVKQRQDGIYGELTAAAVRRWKFNKGFAKKRINTSFTVMESEFMFGRKPTPMMKVRRLARYRARKQAEAQRSVGVKALAVMRSWAKANWRETSWNYVPGLSSLAVKHGLNIGYRKMGYSWCAQAVGTAGLEVGSKAWADLYSGGKFNDKLQLYVPQLWYYALSNQYRFTAVGWDQAQPGDMPVFNWDGGPVDHIGRLIRKIDGNSCVTVEGNTSSGVTGSQSNGDGVYERIRYKSQIVGFIREVA